MRYASIFTGIGGFDVAFDRAAWLAERLVAVNGGTA